MYQFFGYFVGFFYSQLMIWIGQEKFDVFFYYLLYFFIIKISLLVLIEFLSIFYGSIFGLVFRDRIVVKYLENVVKIKKIYYYQSSVV